MQSLIYIKKSPITRVKNIDYRLIPVSQLKMNNYNMNFFNDEVKKCKTYNKIIRTQRGYISMKTRLPAYDVRSTTSCVELTVLDITGIFRIQFRNSGEKQNVQALSGSKCFKIFCELCEKHDINLRDYQIDNGKEIKKEIEKYIIKLEKPVFANKTFNNAHHIDFHSSFPSGLVNTHPEFRPVIEELYNKRKENPVYKLVLNSTIGYMQSMPCCSARWAQLSRDAINDNNKRIRDLALKLKETGHVVLAYNTDGIWYTGDIYHDEYEGKHLGQYENDHTNCKLRFKSAGSYEFIENGQYTPVVRGHTSLDERKPRSDWEWGDIYNFEAVPIKYALDSKGFIHNLTEEGEIFYD